MWTDNMKLRMLLISLILLSLAIESMPNPFFGLNLERNIDFAESFNSIPRAVEMKASQLFGQVQRVLHKGGCEYWTGLDFEAGDIIHCELVPGIADHVLLATSDSQVIHMVGSTDTGCGRILEETSTSYHEREGDQTSHCNVMGSAASPSRAIANARRWKGRYLYYDLIFCKCEHWVNYWATGNALSFQTFISQTNSQCPI